MALTKVSGDFIKDGVLTVGHLHTSHGITTAHIGEGSNLYFTNARVDARIGDLSTSDLSEGTNLYYTQARFNTAFAAKSTSDLSEGSNLYYTDARARSAISVSGNALSYNSSTGVITSNYEESPTFTGNVVINGTLELGQADTASGHINAKELMTFNIDTDNDDTNRYFGWYINGADGSGTELLKILETGAATFAGSITSGAITSSASVIASGNSNSFGNTTVAALTASSITSSGSLSISGNSNSIGTTTFAGTVSIPSASHDLHIGNNLSTTGKVRFGLSSWNNSLGLESYWMVLRTNQNEGLKLIDSAGNTYVQFNASNNSGGAYLSTFSGDIVGYDEIKSRGQIRATGWWGSNSSSENGHAVEIGVSPSNSTEGYILSYNRNGSSYGDLNFDAINYHFNNRSSGTFEVEGSVRTPILYDSQDTTYYINPNSTGAIGAIKTAGGAQIGTTTAHKLVVAGNGNYMNINYDQIWNAGGNLHLQYSSSGNIDMNAGGGYAFSRTSLRAPIFYDHNDTNYYVDPASTGTSINVRGEIANPSVWINDGDNYNNYNENIRLFNAPNSVSVIAFSASGTSGTPTTSILGYSNYLEFRRLDQWQQRLGTNYAEAYGDYRAPIFYDSNNTTYYFNGADTSVSAQVAGPIVSTGPTSGTTAANQAFQVNTTTKGALHSTAASGGTGNSADTAPLVTFTGNGTTVQGGIYVSQNSSTGTTLGFFTTDSYATGPKQSFTIQHNGNTYVNRGMLQANDSVRGQQFYDTNNTSYFLDPTSTTISFKALGDIEVDGDIRGDYFVGTQYASEGYTIYKGYDNWNHMITVRGNTRPGQAKAQAAIVGAHITSFVEYAENNDSTGWWFTGSAGSTYEEIARITKSYSKFVGQLRSPIFYDSNNTTYFIDPASNNSIKTVGDWRSDSSTWTGEFAGKMQYHSNWWYIQTSNGVFVRNASGANNITLSATGVGTANNDWRAPQFYDSANTAYIVDPNGSSAIHDITMHSATATHFGIANTSGSTRDGIALYGGATGGEPTYGLLFTGTSGFGGHGGITSDWATYFTMNNNTNRGWIFRRAGVGNSASITAGGLATFDNSVRTPIFYDSNNTAYYTDPASTSILNYAQIYNLYDAQGTRFTSPEGGVHFTSSSQQTGMIRIKLPSNRRRSNTMMQMTVNVYQYSTGKSFTIRLGGYNYSGGNWYNEFAHMITDSGVGILNVRFGDDGTHDWICIGETNSTWSYCQVMITDFQGGYSGTNSAWGYGWGIDFVTSVPSGHTNTRATSLALTSNNVSYWNTDLYAPAYYDVNNTGYYVNPASSSRMNQIDISSAGASGLLITHTDIRSSATSNWTGDPGGAGKIQYHSNRWYIVSDSSSNRIVQFRRNGSDKCYIDNDGRLMDVHDVRAYAYYDRDNTGYYVDPASTSFISNLTMNGNIEIRRTDPTIFLRDTDHNSAMIHVNSNIFYILRGGNDTTSWATVNGYWPLEINLTNNQATFGGIVQAISDMRSPIYYDRNNTGYYVDPASGTVLNGHQLNYNCRFRASTSGSFNFSTGYGFHAFENGASNEPICVFYNQVATTAVQSYGINVISAAAHNNTTSRFFAGQGGSTERIKIYSNGNIQNSNNSYGQLSDINLKENIVDATPKLDELKQIRVVNFNYIGDIDEETNIPNKQIGVIAQEVEQIFPGLVYECGDTEVPTKSVKYSVFVPMMLKAIQEQQTIIDDLKSRIETLENQ